MPPSPFTKEELVEKAREVIDKIAQRACIDLLACKEAGLSDYQFWRARHQNPELAQEYQNVNEFRAQHYLERAEQLFIDAHQKIEDCDPKIASAIVTLARNHAAWLRQYAALTDKNRWGDTRANVSINVNPNSTDEDIVAAVNVGQKARAEIERLKFEMENKNAK